MRSTSPLFVVLLAVLATVAWPAPLDAAPNSFIDDDNSRFESHIEAARAEGLIYGCNPPNNNRVCPHNVVTRGEMAIMLARAIDAPAASKNHFGDDNGHLAEGAINSLAESGISSGCYEQHFCPDRPISRGEMASLLTRAFRWDSAGGGGQYVDLAGSPHGGALVQLARRGGLLACDAPVNQQLCPRATVRRDEAAFALVTALGLRPGADQVRRSDLEPLGFGDGFYGLSLWDGRTPSSRNRVSITEHGYHETALRVRIPEGSHFGADFKLHLDDAADQVPDQLFFRYYIKLDSDWRTTNSGKLPGFSGVYGSSGKGGYQSRPSDPGWSARLMFTPNSDEDPRVDLGYYVYHLGQEKRYGDGFGWNEAGKLHPGEWYCLEGGIEMNTPGLADGALRAWVDGTPAFDLSGLEFRRPSEPEIKIESFWFNVYYGGKPVAPQDLGLTIDDVMVDTERVGCGAGEGTSISTGGDFNGDGFRDRVRWDSCPTGTCYWQERNDWSGSKVSRHTGDGAWFTLDSHRLGMATGDLDGDGKSDIVYHGRCDNSTRCWRVHTASGGMSSGENWGNGARFTAATDSLILGDFSGDGLDDLTYRGSCTEDDRQCWRVHPSSGKGFKNPRSWGQPPADVTMATAVDMTGDGRDDLVYQAPCDESQCWWAQVSADGAFKKPRALGPALEFDNTNLEWIDFDGDGTADLVSWANSTDQSWIEVRFVRDGALSQPVPLAKVKRQIQDVALRRVEQSAAVQAVVELACGEGETCIRHFMSATPQRLVDSEDFRDARWDRPGAPEIT